MGNSIVLFDIDHTLLNSEQLKAAIENSICDLAKIKKETLVFLNKEFFATLKRTIDFSPRNYIRFLNQRLGGPRLEKEIGSLFFHQESIYQEALYPEVVTVLKKLREEYRLGIFSEGDFEFQMTKVNLSGIRSFLDKELIFIYSDKKGKAQGLVKQLGPLVIVEDNPTHIQDLLSTEGVFPVWIKRGTKAKGHKQLPAPTIVSLLDLRNILGSWRE